ncbi:uncharacterized protein J7T54_003315 [Emericellopsis cladophorae]|uniref:Uncharacterized protein n=1 Tax=Emericellopsis cladophorae TaxID=2686198 RepID=A0A9Q0BBJ8_9HYPO|nr:uncharacterized protein J7T54_003315 [Emericellopsis cladophorae]KAI6778565.1 hypothetical protein J7T54_003315 [Emericellopsis cladophorae]
MMALALQHRVAALRDLGCMLLRESSGGLDECEEEAVLAVVLLLVLHDVCEHGVSSHGAHLDGVAFLCERKVKNVDMSHPSKASILFFIATLSWLDVLRGFSGAEKLAYPHEVRACVYDNWSFGLYMTFGCPPNIFFCIGTVIEAAKAELAGKLPSEEFIVVLRDAEKFLRNWDPQSAVFPSNEPEWAHLATAFRHACLLRIIRWPDTYTISCDDTRIRKSAEAILDACANIPKTSPCYKRMLFPLFMAGVDTSSEHQKHYVDLSIEEIKTCTGFPHYGMTALMNKVWTERKLNSRGQNNVPWMDFTCVDKNEGSQHAYLFF